MKEKIYKLYRECFNKQPIEFQEFFVENNFNGDNASTFFEGDEPTAMVFVCDGKLAFDDKEIDCNVLAGLCVKPVEQKKGLGRKLILKTMREQRELGITAVRVVSDDLKFFEPLGFVPYCFSELKVVENKIDGARILNFEDAESVLEVYKKYCQNYYIKPTRTLIDVQKKLVEYTRFGFAMGYFQNGELKAYSLEKTINIGEEVCYVDKFFCTSLGISTMKIPSETGHIEGLLRVLNLEKFIVGIKFHDDFAIDWKIKFTDELIEQNNVTLHVKIANGTSVVERLEEGNFDLEYTVSDFASTVVRTNSNVIF